MKTRKFFLIVAILIIAALAFYGFLRWERNSYEVPPQTETQQEEKPAEKQSEASEQNAKPFVDDKLGDAIYRGRVTELNDTDITVITNEKETYTYKLTDGSKKDIEALGVKVDSRVIVNFETAEDGTRTALSIEAVTIE